MFEFTKYYSVDSSSFIDFVYYNENTNQLAVELDVDTSLYVYDNVSSEEYHDFISATSAGEYYNATFKVRHEYTKFIPEEDVELVEVAKKDVATGESGLKVTQPNSNLIISSTGITSGNWYFPNATTYTVVFSGGKEYTPKGVNSVDEALREIRNISAALDITLDIEKVIINFKGTE